MSSVKIVIARYNEDLDWVSEIHSTNVAIFDKGPTITANMLNVGREGHTYYQFIVDKYDNLTDTHYAFLQGHPFDHSPHIIERLNAAINAPPTAPFTTLCEKFHITDLATAPCKFTAVFNRVYQTLFGCIPDKHNNDFVFGEGAQFIVTREAILARPREFYQKIVGLLDYDISPPEGYVMERLHDRVFDCESF